MHYQMDIFLHAVYVLAKRKQNGHKNFLLAIAHAIVSYKLDGLGFLKRHKQEDASAFVLTELLPRIKKLGLDSNAKSVLLSVLVARILESEALRMSVEPRTVWEELDLTRVFDQELMSMAVETSR